MDKINGLSDDLLVKILSFLPTEDAVSTSILSKRWECLWKWLPKLEFISRDCSLAECERLQIFLDRNLPLHRAPAIESFRLDFVNSRFKPENIKLWVLVAVSRYLRELEISYYANPFKPNILPSSLYTCKSLVTLKLDGHILLEVPRMVSMSYLKTLQLRKVKYLDGGLSLLRLLSICPILEDLWLEFRGLDNMGMITVIAPTLKSLYICIPYNGILNGLLVNTPSLEYIDFEDHVEESHSCLVKNMPKLEEAYVDVNFPDIESFIRSISSVKRLTLSSEALYVGSFDFNQLEYLKLCVGTDCASDLLVRLLHGSPNLRVLDLFEMDHNYGAMDACWNQPSLVPECILSSLQTFYWSGYVGRPLERDLAGYILTNACCLKTAKISSDDSYFPKLVMIKELSLSSRASTTCQLVFD